MSHFGINSFTAQSLAAGWGRTHCQRHGTGHGSTVRYSHTEGWYYLHGTVCEDDCSHTYWATVNDYWMVVTVFYCISWKNYHAANAQYMLRTPNFYGEHYFSGMDRHSGNVYEDRTCDGYAYPLGCCNYFGGETPGSDGDDWNYHWKCTDGVNTTATGYNTRQTSAGGST
tara:strand:- start:45 stop:554 length:510 start_codon:yes stop_codon:yes gene_type:complete